jgi:hypothetical protein
MSWKELNIICGYCEDNYTIKYDWNDFDDPSEYEDTRTQREQIILVCKKCKNDIQFEIPIEII